MDLRKRNDLSENEYEEVLSCWKSLVNNEIREEFGDEIIDQALRIFLEVESIDTVNRTLEKLKGKSQSDVEIVFTLICNYYSYLDQYYELIEVKGRLLTLEKENKDYILENLHLLDEDISQSKVTPKISLSSDKKLICDY